MEGAVRRKGTRRQPVRLFSSGVQFHPGYASMVAENEREESQKRSSRQQARRPSSTNSAKV